MLRILYLSLFTYEDVVTLSPAVLVFTPPKLAMTKMRMR
jgi:hypothetical protein